MITGVRTALICERVEMANGFPSFHTVADNTLAARTRPGIISFQLVLQVDLDKAETVVQVRVSANNYIQGVNFNLPSGQTFVTLVPVFMVPVTEDSDLVVEVSDESGKPPHRFLWALYFDEHARTLTEDEIVQFAKEADAAAQAKGIPMN